MKFTRPRLTIEPTTLATPWERAEIGR